MFTFCEKYLYITEDKFVVIRDPESGCYYRIWQHSVITAFKPLFYRCLQMGHWAEWCFLAGQKTRAK